MVGYQEGLIEIDKLVGEGRELSEETILRLKKQEHDYLIARIGLQGTLWGAWAALLMIVVVVVTPIFTERSVIEGWQVVAIVVSIIVAVVFFGAFVYNRALSASGKAGDFSGAINAPPR